MTGHIDLLTTIHSLRPSCFLKFVACKRLPLSTDNRHPGLLRVDASAFGRHIKRPCLSTRPTTTTTNHHPLRPILPSTVTVPKHLIRSLLGKSETRNPHANATKPGILCTTQSNHPTRATCGRMKAPFRNSKHPRQPTTMETAQKSTSAFSPGS